MARLIDADLAIAKVKDDGILGAGYSDSERIDDVCDMIDSCPTVDAVEVVRCKDCKYSGMYCFGASDDPTLACLDIEEDGFVRFATTVDPEGYCSKGERKDNE